MHRDIKPNNIVIDPETMNLKIIDWGHAHFYELNKEYSMHVGTGAYKGPELLLKYNYYDYSVDIWAAGCVFSAMLFKKAAFFQRDPEVKYDFVGLLEFMSEILGTQGLIDYIDKYDLSLKTN